MTPWQFLKRSAPRVLLAASVLSGAIITTITPAHSLPISGSVIGGFEIDGDQLSPAADIDWEDVTASIEDDVVFGSSGFTNSSHELSPSAWECTSEAGNPNRTNILHGYVTTHIVDNEFFLDLGVVRRNITSLGQTLDELVLPGDSHETAVSAEISQGGFEVPGDFLSGDVDCSHSRQAGDLLVDWTYDDINNGFATTADAYSWDATDPDGAGELEGSWSTGNLVSTDARGATNAINAPITDVLFGNAAVQGRKFSEATVNLTQALDLGPEDCRFEGTVQFRSRNNNGLFEDDGDQANLEDWIVPVPVSFDICGTINIVKDTVPAGVDQIFGFEGDLGAFDLNDGGDPGGDFPVDRIPGDDIEVTELGLDGFDLTDLVCVSDEQDDTSTTDLVTRTASIDLSAGETVTCTYTNTQRASVTIIKDTQPDSGQDFTFNATGPNFVDSATLDDDGDNGNGVSNTATRLLLPNPVGQPYVVTEESVPGFALVDIDCLSDGEPVPLLAVQVLDQDGNLVGIQGNLDPGQDLVCTFVNQELASVTIVKDTTPDGPQDFTFNATGPNGFAESATLDDDGDNANALSNTETRQLLPNPVGQPYVVTEAPVPGFSLADIDCTSDGVPVPLLAIQVLDQDGNLIGIQGNLDPGQDLACVFSNTELPSVTIIKDTQPNGPQDFTFNATGPDGFAASATLDDDSDPTLENSVTVNVLPNPEPAAPYVVTETLVPGFELTSVDCFLNGVALPLAAIQVLDLDGNLVGIGGNLNPADDLVCTFVNDAQAGDLTVAVEGGDPTFVIAPDPQGVSPFTLDEGEDITFEDLPAGVYTVTMTDLEAGLEFDGVDCDPEEISFETVGDPSVTFTVADDASITCTFTVSDVDDGYNQYPGDTDFDFDTPFDDDDPAPAAEVAGNNQSNPTGNQAPAEQPQAPLAVLPETAAQPPAVDAAPVALDALPRTGSGAGDLAGFGGLLLIIGGLATVVGRSRRKASQA